MSRIGIVSQSMEPFSTQLRATVVARCGGRGVSASRFWTLLAATLLFGAGSPAATAQQPEMKPYDEKLTRLSEILGAVHYLRELCGNNDGQLWRDRMRDLIEGEGTSPMRRAKLTKSFNDGYRSYSRTYQSCTPTAKIAINRFLTEGAQLADGLVKTVP